jgi:hypothetical protein
MALSLDQGGGAHNARSHPATMATERRTANAPYIGVLPFIRRSSIKKALLPTLPHPHFPSFYGPSVDILQSILHFISEEVDL